MKLELEGKVALVTGGSTGIGAGIVRGLAAEGCDVAFVHWEDWNGASNVAETVRGMGRKALPIESDVSRCEAAGRAVNEVIDEFDTIDILVCNAGVAMDRALWNMTETEWDRVLAVNLKGCFNYCRAVAPLMRSRKSGRIVNIASINGMRGKFGQANYAASKGGMIALTKTIARELGPSGVTANAIAPGLVMTEMTRDLPAEFKKAAVDESVVGRAAEVEDVADLTIFLCSNRARHITGECIRVDGGQYI